MNEWPRIARPDQLYQDSLIVQERSLRRSLGLAYVYGLELKLREGEGTLCSIKRTLPGSRLKPRNSRYRLKLGQVHVKAVGDPDRVSLFYKELEADL